MKTRAFDFERQRKVVAYLRMSSKMQAETSPEQQLREIKKVITDRNLPWTIVRTYCDRAKSGRRVKHRAEFKQMLQDIRSGAIDVDLILVDTIERFGRMKNLEAYRQDLEDLDGVLVLTADRRFADPHDPASRLMSVLENVRAADDSRIKGHNVRRGKEQAIKDGFWPGSPPPFGYRLEVVHIEKRHGREVKHHKLAPHESHAPIVKMLFEQSAANPSWGQDRLAKWLNELEGVPDDCLPFNGATVGRWLKNPIYHGELVWGLYSSDIRNDRRVLDKNEAGEELRLKEFCEPIASRGVLERVEANCLRRKKRSGGSKQARRSGRGMNLRYPLSGLVRCGDCGAAMVASSTAPYTTKSGEERRYPAYACPSNRSGGCTNNLRIKEPWLREKVITTIRRRLLSTPEDLTGFCESVRELVESKRRQLRQQQDSLTPLLLKEREHLEKQIRGWEISLSQSDLHEKQRNSLVEKSTAAYSRIEEIELAIDAQDREKSAVESMLREKDITERLERLSEVLADTDPTAANLELSLHIDRIDCFGDGRVVSRTCKIGSTPDAVRWFAQREDLIGDTESSSTAERSVKPRQRAFLRVSSEDFLDTGLRDRIEWAIDPHRFQGLPDEWFWIDEFQFQKYVTWPLANYARVQARCDEIKAAGGKPTLKGLAEEFGVSGPTIKKSLDVSKNVGEGLPPEKPRLPGTKVKDNLELQAEIARLHDEGVTLKAIAERLGLGKSAVRRSLARLYKDRGQELPDLRTRRRKH